MARSRFIDRAATRVVAREPVLVMRVHDMSPTAVHRIGTADKPSGERARDQARVDRSLLALGHGRAQAGRDQPVQVWR